MEAPGLRSPSYAPFGSSYGIGETNLLELQAILRFLASRLLGQKEARQSERMWEDALVVDHGSLEFGAIAWLRASEVGWDHTWYYFVRVTTGDLFRYDCGRPE